MGIIPRIAAHVVPVSPIFIYPFVTMKSDDNNGTKSMEKTPKKHNRVRTDVASKVLAKSKLYVSSLSEEKPEVPRSKRKLTRAPLSADAKVRKHQKAYGKKNKNEILRKIAARDSQEQKRNLALQYIKEWQNRTDGGTWKFHRLRQDWLIKNMYCSKQLPEDDFGILLEYLKGLKGNLRTRLIEETEAIYNECEAKLENTEENSKKSPIKYKRSRKILKNLL